MLYLGAKYAPLRNEFADIKRIVKREVVDVLITTGGTDQYGVAFELLRVLKEEGIFSGLRFHFVIGSIYENVEEYEALASQCSNVLLHKGLQSMSRLMLECDVAVSAGGTTLLELCACGTPAIVFSVSENQKEWVRQMINYEYMVGVGDITWNRQDKIPGIFEHLSILIEDYSLRQQLSIKMQSLVDGGGAKRIAEGLIELNEEG